MKNKPLVTTVIIVAFIAAALLLAYFWPGESVEDVPLIVLPGEGGENSTQAEIQNKNREIMTGITVDRENVCRVIATLERSHVYTVRANIRYYAGDTEYKGVSDVICTENLVRSSLQLDGRYLEYLLTDNMYYSWEKGSEEYYSGPRGSATADSVGLLPTWEDAASVPSESITDASFGDYLGVSCISMSFDDAESGLSFTHYISVDWGLLIASETRLGERLLYKMTAETIELSATADRSYFRLPDGNIPG